MWKSMGFPPSLQSRKMSRGSACRHRQLLLVCGSFGFSCVEVSWLTRGSSSVSFCSFVLTLLEHFGWEKYRSSSASVSRHTVHVETVLVTWSAHPSDQTTTPSSLRRNRIEGISWLMLLLHYFLYFPPWHEGFSVIIHFSHFLWS